MQNGISFGNGFIIDTASIFVPTRPDVILNPSRGEGRGGRDRNEHPINPAKIFVLLMIFRVIKHFPPPPFWKIFPVIPVPVSLVPFDNLDSHEYICTHPIFKWKLEVGFHE